MDQVTDLKFLATVQIFADVTKKEKWCHQSIFPFKKTYFIKFQTKNLF